MIRAILFDFDGTLAKPTLDFALMRQRVYETLACYGKPLSPQTPALEGIAEICSGLDAALACEAKAKAHQSIVQTEIEAAKRSQLFPFVRPMLATLAANHINVGIVTRNCREAVLTVFPDMPAHFPLVTRHDVTRVKPHPEHVEAALKLLGCPPEYALMVGDHPTDIIAGQQAGTKTAGVATGESSLEELQTCNPTYLAQHAGELLKFLTVS